MRSKVINPGYIAPSVHIFALQLCVMKFNLFSFILLFILVACKPPLSGNPEIEIHTRFGEIVIELYPVQAPATVAAFLARIDSGYYKNSSFYRVLTDQNQPSNAPKAELIQGGLWETNYRLAKEATCIPHENTRQTGLSHTNGVISMARQEPGSAGTEFFLVIGDQPGLDYGGNNNSDGQGYAAFGKVIKGMNVVYKIQRQPEYDQHFDPLVSIYEIVRR